MRINVIKLALIEVKKMCNERTGCEGCPFARKRGANCLFDAHPDAETNTLPFEWDFSGLEMDADGNV